MPAIAQFSSPLQPLTTFSTDENVHREEDNGFLESHYAQQFGHDDRKLPRRSDVSIARTISPPPESILSGDFQYVPHRNRPAFRTPSSIKAQQLAPSPIASPRLPKSAPHTDRKWSVRAVRRSDFMSDVDSMDGTADDAQDDLDSGLNGLGSESPMFRRLVEAKKQEDIERHLRLASSQAGPAQSLHTAQQHERNTPLVLLHVSILPSQQPAYPLTVLQAANAPSWVVENILLFREKLCSAVLARGVLIPHPGEEYDVLEERLLEALELCAPRVLADGHFYDEQGTYDSADEDEVDGFTETGVNAKPRAICDYAHGDSDDASHHHHDHNDDDDGDDDFCTTCAQPMRLPYRGTGHGKRRWDVRFYASNGLMRAGAWNAAWQEMERVDVEIQPWMPQDVRIALDTAMEREIRADAQQHDASDALKSELERRIHQLECTLQTSQSEIARLLHEAATNKVNEAETIFVAVPERKPSVPVINTKMTQQINPAEMLGKDIPLDQLLKNYLVVLAQDKRNVAMAGLMVLIALLLSILMGGRNVAANAHVQPQQQLLESCRPVPVMIPSRVIGSDTSALSAGAPSIGNVGSMVVQSADLPITRSNIHASSTTANVGNTISATVAGS
jgi:hypothetical protein